MLASNNWKNRETAQLFAAVLKLKSASEAENFFRDLLTLGEIKELATRFRVARMLDDGQKTYLEIAKEAETTTATVTRVAQWLRNGTGGYRTVINRLKHHRPSHGGVG